MRKLKLLVLLCVVLFTNSTSAQNWLTAGNTLTSTGILGGNSGNFDIVFKRNGVQSGLLNSANSNTSWGVGALNPSATGTLNTAIGTSALTANTTGYNNIAIGSNSLGTNTTGYQNIALGVAALNVSQGVANIAIGSYCLVANTSGSNNVATGYEVLGHNTTGQQSAAVGYQALLSNTTGSNNTGLGFGALNSNTTGSNNLALGYNANVSAGGWSNATAIGANAVVGQSNSIVLGSSVNVGVGTSTPNSSALLDLTSTTQGLLPPRIALTATNSASPLAANVAGMILYNTATAGTSPNNVTPGYYYNNGTAWVRLTDATSPGWSLTGNAGTTPGTNFIGTTDDKDVIFKVNNIQAGLLDNTNNNTSWGVQALSPSSTGTGNVANGAQALYLNTTGYSNVANGMQSLYSNTSGYWNVANGVQSLYSNTTGYYNVANGFVALYSNTTGTVNVANGFAALYSNTTGYGNVADGQGALYYNTTGATNTAVGNGALSNNTIGIAGVAVGSGALSLNTTGNQNTAIGNEALLSITTGGYNIGVGTGAGGFNSTGYYNTSVGGGAGPYVDGLNNTSAFGSDTYTYASNTMAFGDTTTIGWGFAAARPTATNVFVVGTTSSNGNGAYLTAGGVWTNASDQNLKEDFTTPDSKDVLSRIKKMSVTKWKYKGTSEYHVGPMAQDFYSAFNLGTDNKHISTIDPAGVALIAIQELATQNDSLQSANTQQQEINAQQQQANNNLQQQLNDLKTTISQMQTAMSQCCNSYSSNMTKEAASPLVVTGADAARLQQNAPNPYTGSTVIAYHLPQSTTNAEIIVSDLTGSVIKSVSLTGTGDGQITLSAGSLASGSYFYTLLVNGQKIDTKQMIIAQ